MDDIENYPTMEKIQKSQSECPELKKVIDCLNKGKEIEAGPYKQYTNLSIKDGLLCKGLRIIVPDEWQEPVVRELYEYMASTMSELLISWNYVEIGSTGEL